jgi:type IV fimbrial biogenesis protein FimT
MTHLRSRGLTLIELMIAVAVVAVLMALAAPSFEQAVNGNRLSSAAAETIAAAQLARSEAIRHNRRVVLCRSEDGSACSATNASWPGWIVFVDTDADGTRDNDEPVVKSGTVDAPLQLLASAAVVGANQRITFRGDGTARTAAGQLFNGSVAVCMATLRPAENVRHISLASGSRTAVRRTNAGGACAAPTDA